MRFNSYFEQDFLTNERISLSNVICSEENKTFKIFLKGERLIEVASLKKLVAGMKKLSSDRLLRKYDISYSISYSDLRSSDEKLYIEYFRCLLTEVVVDYELLSLSNLNVSFDGKTYIAKHTASSKVNEAVVLKANKIFAQFGLNVDIKLELIDKEVVKEIKNEIILEEEQQMIKNIEEAKEVSLKKKAIEESQKKSKYVKPTIMSAVEPIKNIPNTQLGLDECINTTGSLSFTIEGHIFDITHTKFPKSELYQIAITDGTDSISVKRFVKSEAEKETYEALKINDIIRVTGTAVSDTYAREVVLNANKILYIGVKEEKVRKDLALEKRVELHLHTNMSALDAVSSATSYIKEAIKWGHKAIAFTDHDGVYSFHDIMVATMGKDIKPIYGVELGFVDEDKFNIAYTVEDFDLRNSTYVVFDLETTGFSVTYDRIIQIAARKVLHGQVIETFDYFINPEMPIPAKITELTTITDDMVANAPLIEEILPKFLEFIDGAILVAQNASFDVGHIYANMERLNIKHKEFPVIDTMQLARNFYHEELKFFNLKSLARYFKIQQEHHHLADDDTRVTTEIFLQMLQTLYKHNIYNYKDINSSIYFSNNSTTKK